MPDVSSKQIWARDILLTMTAPQKLHSWINWNLVKSILKRSIVDESKFIRLLFGPVAVFVCRHFDLSPFWPVAVLTIGYPIITMYTSVQYYRSALAPQRVRSEPRRQTVFGGFLVATIFRSFSGYETSNCLTVIDKHRWTVSHETNITKLPFNQNVQGYKDYFPSFCVQSYAQSDIVNSVL